MQSIKYWFESAMSYQISGDKENAIKLYRKVIEIDPNNAASMDNLSLLVDPTESLELLRRSLKIKRNDAKDHVQNPIPITSIEARKLRALTA